MAYPVTTRYFLNFRNSDTGLTPVFLFFKRADTFVPIAAPTVTELSNGRYYFDWTWTAITDPNIVFQIDGGVSIPTEEVRYIAGGLSSRDTWTDSLVDAVWNDVVDRAGGTKGDFVETIGTVSTNTTASNIANAVWNEVIASHTTAGTFGQTLQLADSGLAQGGAASTVTLRAGASGIADFYKNGLIAITSGTGAGQSRSITGYVGTTQVATVDRAWGTQPIVGSGYIILPAAPSSSLTNLGIAGAVWDEQLSGHLATGTTGLKLNTGGGSIKFYANGDTVNPIIIQVASPKHTQVKVTYSEPVVMTTAANGALNPTNYNIPGLTVLAVTSLTSQQVLLTTSTQTADYLYTLTVSNIEDLAGNPIV